MCYTYDSLGRVLSRTVKDADDAVLREERFTYDAPVQSYTTRLKQNGSIFGLASIRFIVLNSLFKWGMQMKKTILFVLAALVLFSLNSCLAL